jgi:3,4-dihydroxy 2-butanone 4-phosphate synthase/GTP cyclohydrolase II
MKLNTTEEIIDDIRLGKMVVIMDDESRENEGDLVMAASAVTPEDVNFMARFGRGLICVTLTRECCKRLNLPLMVSDTYFNSGTNFTVSIEAARGVTTGISAADRALTIQAAVAPDAKPTDIVQPGHIFPLMAKAGGVLTRAGHTEAGCDLARLAGLEPAAVIVEILNDDGTMARRSDLEIFAEQHQLKIGTVADLIRYRVENEKTVACVARCRMPTPHGEFTMYTYQDSIADHLHIALVKGEIKPDVSTLVRVHISNPVVDLTCNARGEQTWPLQDVIKRVAQEESGVLVILCNQFDTSELIWQVNNYQSEDQGREAPARPEQNDLRTIGLGSQILADLGVKKMRVLSAPKKIHSISGFGLEVTEYVSS